MRRKYLRSNRQPSLFSFPHAHTGVTLVAQLRVETIMKPIVLMLMFAMAAVYAVSQTPGQKPAFEVASIKRNMSSTEGSSMGGGAGRFVARNMTLRALIQF